MTTPYITKVSPLSRRQVRGGYFWPSSLRLRFLHAALVVASAGSIGEDSLFSCNPKLAISASVACWPCDFVFEGLPFFIRVTFLSIALPTASTSELAPELKRLSESLHNYNRLQSTLNQPKRIFYSPDVCRKYDITAILVQRKECEKRSRIISH